MLKRFGLLQFKFLSYVPVLQYVLNIIYAFSCKRVKKSAKNIPEIFDLILTSNSKSADFRFGASDYNLILIVKDESSPKKVLKQLRQIINGHPLTHIVFNTRYLPVLTEKEFKTHAIRSYLKSSGINQVFYWKSIITNKIYDLKSESSIQFSSLFNSYNNLDYYLFRMNMKLQKRHRIKHIIRSLQSLKYFSSSVFVIKQKKIQKAILILKYPLSLIFFYDIFIKNAWKVLPKIDLPINKGRIRTPINLELRQYLEKLLNDKLIQDITITPSLIQQEGEIKGKLYIEVHLNTLIIHSRIERKLLEIKQKIKNFQSENRKLRVRFMNQGTYFFQNKYLLYPYPLEPIYRRLKTESLNNFNYSQDFNQEYIVKSITHFLISQVFKFRSLEQKSSLIGSKFIKSLNLMFRYYQITYYLKNKKFLLTTDENEIRSYLTPQFSSIHCEDNLEQEHWVIVKQQMIYLLKQIKKELILYDISLKHLRL